MEMAVAEVIARYHSRPAKPDPKQQQQRSDHVAALVVIAAPQAVVGDGEGVCMADRVGVAQHVDRIAPLADASCLEQLAPLVEAASCLLGDLADVRGVS